MTTYIKMNCLVCNQEFSSTLGNFNKGRKHCSLKCGRITANKSITSTIDHVIQKIKFGAGCWVWKERKNQDGYGTLKFHGKRHHAHKFIYELFFGKVPNGLELDHLCSNRPCVNPNHLEPVTHKENIGRGRTGKYLSERTHCKNGHEYNSENTRISVAVTGTTYRQCKQCLRDGTKRWRERNSL